jgi:hypothetical protein
MWVLMYVFSYSVNPAATNDKAEWRLYPNVVFQEFLAALVLPVGGAGRLRFPAPKNQRRSRSRERATALREFSATP